MDTTIDRSTLVKNYERAQSAYNGIHPFLVSGEWWRYGKGKFNSKAEFEAEEARRFARLEATWQALLDYERS
jgi:hypothetical protein